MSTYEDLFTYLTALSGLTALISSRLYPVTIPQGAEYPCVRLRREDDGGFSDFDGQGATITTRLDVDCMADDVESALAIAKEVRDALKSFTGSLGTRRVVRATLSAEFDSYEPELSGGKYRAAQAWTLWHY